MPSADDEVTRRRSHNMTRSQNIANHGEHEQQHRRQLQLRQPLQEEGCLPAHVDNERSGTYSDSGYNPQSSSAPTANSRPTDTSKEGRVRFSSRETSDILKHIAAAATGAVLSETATLPLDVVKTRLQVGLRIPPTRETILSSNTILIRATPAAHAPSMLGEFRTILRAEGTRGLFSGFTPAVARQILYTGGRAGTYTFVRDLFDDYSSPTVPCSGSATQGECRSTSSSGSQPSLRTSSGLGGSGSTSSSYSSRLLAGGVTGAFFVFIAVPFEVVKTRLQASAVYRSRGVLRSFSNIYRTEGVRRGIFSGALPAVQRAFVLSSIELSTYDTAKGFVMQKFRLGDRLPASILASTITGAVVTLAVTPFDVIKTRMMAASLSSLTGEKPFKGVVDCIQQTVREGGIRSLYRGVVPIYLRLGPGTTIFFATMEYVNRLLSYRL